MKLKDKFHINFRKKYRATSCIFFLNISYIENFAEENPGEFTIKFTGALIDQFLEEFTDKIQEKNLCAMPSGFC